MCDVKVEGSRSERRSLPLRFLFRCDDGIERAYAKLARFCTCRRAVDASGYMHAPSSGALNELPRRVRSDDISVKRRCPCRGLEISLSTSRRHYVVSLFFFFLVRTVAHVSALQLHHRHIIIVNFHRWANDISTDSGVDPPISINRRDGPRAAAFDRWRTLQCCYCESRSRKLLEEHTTPGWH